MSGLWLVATLSGCGRQMGVSSVGEDVSADDTTSSVDADEDGYAASDDCDDDDATRNPDAEETAGDGVDSNCDGEDDT